MVVVVKAALLVVELVRQFLGVVCGQGSLPGGFRGPLGLVLGSPGSPPRRLPRPVRPRPGCARLAVAPPRPQPGPDQPAAEPDRGRFGQPSPGSGRRPPEPRRRRSAPAQPPPPPARRASEA